MKAREKLYWDAVAARDKAQDHVDDVMQKAFAVGDLVEFSKGKMAPAPARIEMVSGFTERLQVRNMNSDKVYWIETYHLTSNPEHMRG